MQPFTSQLVQSNPRLFKYDIVWDKKAITGFLNAKHQVLRRHETILLFSKRRCTYNPQMTEGKPYTSKNGAPSTNYGKQVQGITVNTGYRYPTSIIQISNANKASKTHPTQKPVELFEWLIKTFSDEGDVVLDNCMGSGTTAIACMRTGRNYVGFELDENYYNLACERIEKEGSVNGEQ